jgi:hypothetical protein
MMHHGVQPSAIIRRYEKLLFLFSLSLSACIFSPSFFFLLPYFFFPAFTLLSGLTDIPRRECSPRIIVLQESGKEERDGLGRLIL